MAGAAAGIYNLRCYMRTGTYVGNAGSAAGWTQVGSVNVNITAGFPTVLLFDIPFTTTFNIPGGGTAGFYIVANNGAGTTVRVVATLTGGDTDDGTLRIESIGEDMEASDVVFDSACGIVFRGPAGDDEGPIGAL